MTPEEFESYLEDGKASWNIDIKDNVIGGVLILNKYFDITKERVLLSCDSDYSDTIYGPTVDDLIKKNITADDVISLGKLSWDISSWDGTYNEPLGERLLTVKY